MLTTPPINAFDLSKHNLSMMSSDTQVENAVVSWGDGLGTGQDVIIFGSDPLISQLSYIPGIEDVVVRIKDGAGPTTDDNIVIDDGITPGVDVEKSSWDTSRITVAQV